MDLNAITKNGRVLFLAYDHGMEHGPTDFDDETIDPAKIIEIADSGFFTGVILQKGIAEKYYPKDPTLSKEKQSKRVPLIVKLNGKTNLLNEVVEPYSPQLCSVDEAISLGAGAVGYTVYIGSENEAKMLAEFAKIEEECQQRNLPLIGWMYPRGKSVEGREHTREILAYAARIGLETGAEMVKLPYTGDPESFKWVVESAGKTKVVVMGGNKMSEEEFLKYTEEVMTTGAIGLAVGRNVWRSSNPLAMAERLAGIIYG